LDELSKPNLAASAGEKRAEMRVLRLRQARIDFPVEQRGVDMHTLDSKESRRKHGSRHARKIDLVT